MGMHTRGLLAMALVLSLGACQSTGEAQSSEQQRIERALARMDVRQGESLREIPDFMIRGWQDIDDRNLIVTAGMHDHYLLHLATPCIELPFALRIGFDTVGGRVSRMDSVVVYSLHRPLERCRIQAIYRLEDIGEEP